MAKNTPRRSKRKIRTARRLKRAPTRTAAPTAAPTTAPQADASTSVDPTKPETPIDMPIRVSSALDRPLTLHQFCVFKALGIREDFMAVTVPVTILRAAEAIALAVTRPYTTVVHASLLRGMARLRARDEVQMILNARKALIPYADDSLDTWKFSPANRSGTRRIWIRKLRADDKGDCAELSRTLGLTESAFVSLAIVVGLFDVPSLAAPLQDVLRAEMDAFRSALQQRAVFADAVSKSVTVHPVRPSYPMQWWQMDGDVEE
jgi:hypothetical protein